MTDWSPPERYVVLQTVHGLRVYLDMAEADRLGAKLDGMLDLAPHDRAEADPMFVTFTDLTGAECRFRTTHIDALWESTPETRERDDQIEAMHKARRGWSE